MPKSSLGRGGSAYRGVGITVIERAVGRAKGCISTHASKGEHSLTTGLTRRTTDTVALWIVGQRCIHDAGYVLPILDKARKRCLGSRCLVPAVMSRQVIVSTVRGGVGVLDA